jgi:ABC-2 type transport system ATP-binding protein
VAVLSWGGVATAAAPTPPAYTSQLLHFEVHVDSAGLHTCDVLGELFTPAVASPSNRMPAILTTNGFGGSYHDQVGEAEAFAQLGYVVLTYSGLGFGGSGCQITLDDPDWDGEAASQLVSFLGGENGIAFTDAAHTDAVPGLSDVIHDPVDHAGTHDQYDPRVGMIGGSYGGEVQFAAASVDPRIDTIIPIITWNNLAYSLAPNDASASSGVADYTPGAVKSTWAVLFSVEGIADGLQGASGDPSRLIGCPNFATWVCPALLFGGALGFPYPSMLEDLEHASVSSYMPSITIPTLLMQGENDTLFNLNEAIANYQALRAQGTPVDMVWQSWGHSSPNPAPGEIDLDHPNPTTQYETGRIVNWFNHYLKGEPVSTGPGFAYFRDWVSYQGNAAPAYASAPSYPVGTLKRFYLSGGKLLVPAPGKPTGSTQAFLTTGAGLPTSIAAPDAVASSLPPIPQFDLTGTDASWTSAPLTSALNVVGSPVLHLSVLAPTAALSQVVGPPGQLVLFAKVFDVSPGGKAQLINGLVAPSRLTNVNEPFTITLPAIAHQFGPHDRIEVVLAAGDLNYRGGLVASPVVITTGSTSQVLTLPVVGP